MHASQSCSATLICCRLSNRDLRPLRKCQKSPVHMATEASCEEVDARIAELQRTLQWSVRKRGARRSSRRE